MLTAERARKHSLPDRAVFTIGVEAPGFEVAPVGTAGSLR